MSSSFELLARHRAESPLFVHDERVVTAGEARASAEALVAHLDALGAGDLVVGTAVRDRVGVALFAAALSGRTLRFPATTDRGVDAALAVARDGVVVHAGERTDGLDLRAFDRAAAGGLAPIVVPDATLAVFHSSGTTGDPRPFAKSAGELLAEATMHVERLRLDPGFSIVATVPSTHLYGFLFALLVPIVGGGRVAISAPTIPQAIAELCGRVNADVLVSVPAHLRAFGALLPDSFRRGPRVVVSSGAPLDDDDACALAARLGSEVQEILGSTETGGLGVRVAGETGFAPLPLVRFVGLENERLVIASRYVDGSVDAPVPTQDRGTILENGRFVHAGRADDVVKIAGTRVSLAEVEAALRGIEGVSDACVRVERGTPLHGARLVALVASPGLEATTVRHALVAKLPAMAVPKRIVVVESIPRGAAGKVSALDVDRLLGLTASSRPSLRLERSVDDGRYEVDVPVGAREFDGHFPGRPILPGVVQLRGLVLAASRREWPTLTHPTRISRVKFKRPVGPGERLDLRLSRPSDLRVQFVLSTGGVEVASGIFHFD